ncbi:OmpA family protein [Aureispira anguillae]|uniref:OmpA family protein n=1 Tax=Aureispira anguillae TaxID=2864201 RepID=A0A915YM06_9BACT|nr:OmpA family protein [Aureispira anguillae]BDS15382.1 OmpA family protein [Aureispira anguillae]
MGNNNHFILIVLLTCLNIEFIQAYQMTVPTAIYVENAYNLKAITEAKLTVKQKETDGKYYTYGVYHTDSTGTVNLSLNKDKTYTITTKKQDYYTQITVLSTNDISRTGKNKFGLSMRPKNCYRIKGQVRTDVALTGNNFFILKDLESRETETVAIDNKGYYFACGQCGRSYLIIPFLDNEQQQIDTINLLEQYCQDRRNPLLEFNIQPQKISPKEEVIEEEKGKFAKGDSVLLENLVFEGKTRQLNKVGNEALEVLYQTLSDNPQLIVELHIHTDARKSERYNWLLAQRRGKFIHEFLIEKGIEINQFSIVPVGESQIINHCTNGKSCSKAEHAINNRVEMKVLQGDKDFLD